MKTATFQVPAMYGDHHVIEVKKILMELPGVDDVYASSAFQTVEVSYLPDKLTDEQIEACLIEAGYLGDWIIPKELGSSVQSGISTDEDSPRAFLRHTAVFETTKSTVSFAQNVPYSGRPLWNCPGIGVIKKDMEE